MNNIFITFFSIIIIVSCNRNTQLLKDISLLQKRPVMLTKQSELIAWDINPKMVNEIPNVLKYIIYKGSHDCTSCAINNMYHWDEFIEYAKTYNGRLRFYFIYSPSNMDRKNIEFILRNGNLHYPILLDTLGEFEKLNPHLPKNKALHTFLLDENNNVILVGSPVNNKKIKELFYKIVEEKLGKLQALPIRDSIN